MPIELVICLVGAGVGSVAGGALSAGTRQTR